ncbi:MULTISPECIES: TlpA family protein disulfide reductase [Paenibacillus]|uniref:TlpA family protein disulfide reductase n=1 Tax=Paenibacillus TaxID=44249 RepID=UPI00017884F1|nr:MULTISPECIES: TlpA disulfide reductase family protein [Paenibacillus]ACX66815.1 Redoxin domain protein [Paenibacillus sp. Y412MC10]MCM3259284.1 TlpA family protein disulfide reductase [Paenibacillus lautus]
MKRNIILIVLLLIAAGAVVYNQAGDDIQAVFMQEKPLPTETGAKAGLLAPTFTLKGMDDKSYSGGGARDKAMLVNFWASWCEPCKQEAPELDKLAAEYASELEIYGVNVSKYDNAKKARQFVQDFNLQYPILLDTKGEVFEELYKGQVFPTNVLIDRNGVIQEIILGAPDPKDLRKKVAKLIN